MTQTVTVVRDGPLTNVRLERAEKYNAFDADLVDRLLDAVTEGTTDGTRLMVFSGDGRGFSSGFDLDGLDDTSDGDMVLRFVRVEQLLQAVYHAPFATLALSHGPCFGAAADLVAACDHRIADPGGKFRMPGPKFDVVLGTRRLTQLVGADRARRLILRETPFDAETALEAGFVQELIPQDEWPSAVESTLATVLGFSDTVYAALSQRMATDTRDADLAALVRSVSEGSITDRLREYVNAMKAARGKK